MDWRSCQTVSPPVINCAVTEFSASLFRVPQHRSSKTKLYRLIYAVTGPALPVLKAWMPGFVTSTGQLGRAMLQAAKHGASKPVFENSDINGF